MPYVCVHAHYYQPSREDPWTGAWPVQPGARPYRDWNTRITAECYAPNAAARLLDAAGRTRAVRNTYRDVSFDAGPTLLQWLERNRRVVYDAILRADADSEVRFGGHGVAMAQGYHHSILPLADDRDLKTEVAWGVRDFELRFRRRPEGFWAPEAAIDLRTLDVMAQAGVRFLVVAPYQLKRVRPHGAERWMAPSEVPDLTRRSYRVALPGGRHIALFPYDEPISRGIAFEGWLRDGTFLGRKLAEAALSSGSPDALAHCATDGESYGHHHLHGEMALARALEVLDADPRVELTSYGQHLERVPPTWDAEIVEDTSWSCAHGIERWRSDCGCHVGSQPGWHQRWRGPLRDAMDALRDAARAAMAPHAERVFIDPDVARNAYVELLRDHEPDVFHDWLATHGGTRRRSQADDRIAHAILETERHLLAMYTSCGWFFDDATGIEARQNIRHAACALGLLRDVLGVDLHEDFERRMGRLPSNRDPSELVELVSEARHHPRPVRAPHAPAALTMLAEEGEALEPAEREAVSSLFDRATGLLLHVSSLPGDGVVGDLDAARDLIDWLADAGVSVWQVLPLSPTDDSGSPYSSWADMCANPWLTGLAPLVKAGLLTPAEVASQPEGPIGAIDLGLASAWKTQALEVAARRLLANPSHPLAPALATFRAQSPWALDAGLFRALRTVHGGRPWWQWEPTLRARDPDALAEAASTHADAVDVWVALQFFFDRQWREVRAYAAARGVRILGDLPIYVGWDSVDVWAHQSLFQLDDTGHPTHVSGAPPDAFSELGQRWGNPCYAWEIHESEGFAWWKRRVRRALAQTDFVRLDHFLGFVNYWSIPADAEDARAGTWLPGPGRALFDALESALGTLPVVVEDLGVISPAVRKLQLDLGYPGMRILHFAFDGDERNGHLPRNHPDATVAYAGTHDNDTTIGWWNELTPRYRKHVRSRFTDPDGSPSWELVRLICRSPAWWAIATPQDLLGLGSEARMNVPGTITRNWTWRLRPGQLDAYLAARMHDLVSITGRLPPSSART